MHQPIGRLKELKCPRCAFILDKNDTICPKCGKVMTLEGIDKPTQFIKHFDH